jgi:hypothetical protein
MKASNLTTRGYVSLAGLNIDGKVIILWHVDRLLGSGPQTATEERCFLRDPLSNN